MLLIFCLNIRKETQLILSSEGPRSAGGALGPNASKNGTEPKEYGATSMLLEFYKKGRNYQTSFFVRRLPLTYLTLSRVFGYPHSKGTFLWNFVPYCEL